MENHSQDLLRFTNDPDKDRKPNTEGISGKAQMLNSVVVYFDPDCFYCRNIAHFMNIRGRKTSFWTYEPLIKAEGEARALKLKIEVEWSSRSSEADARVQIFEDEAAWKFIVEHEPMLSGVSWMLEKLGISSATSAKAMASGASILRRFCSTCPNE